MAAADAGVDCDSLSGLQSGDVPADFANDSGRIAAHNLRHGDFDSGHAAAEKDVNVIDGCGLDLDQDIERAGGWRFDIGVLKYFGPAVLVKNDCFHLTE